MVAPLEERQGDGLLPPEDGRQEQKQGASDDQRQHEEVEDQGLDVTPAL